MNKTLKRNQAHEQPSDHPQSNDFVLEPADNARLANLCGQFDEHLKQIERRLGVEINNRGNVFRVIGDARPVHAAGIVLKNLYAETIKGPLTPAHVRSHTHGVFPFPPCRALPQRGSTTRWRSGDD